MRHCVWSVVLRYARQARVTGNTGNTGILRNVVDLLVLVVDSGHKMVISIPQVHICACVEYGWCVCPYKVLFLNLLW